MTTTIFIYMKNKLTLSDSLSAFANIVGAEPATAILYSPRKCELATCTDGVLHGSDGQSLEIKAVFEARVFSESAELRWLNDPGPEQCHKAVILSEQEQPYLGQWQIEKQNNVIETLPQTYLLWGEGTGRHMYDGWSELAAARIGSLRVPMDCVGRNDRVLLHSLEYVVEADHGNAVIFDERLKKLEVIRG